LLRAGFGLIDFSHSGRINLLKPRGALFIAAKNRKAMNLARDLLKLFADSVVLSRDLADIVRHYEW
jgi:hypothetical protein